MTEQKPMGTADAPAAGDEAKQARIKKAADHMKDRGLEDRVRAAHPHAAESDAGTDAMLADYDRLKGEADKNAGGPVKGVSSSG